MMAIFKTGHKGNSAAFIEPCEITRKLSKEKFCELYKNALTALVRMGYSYNALRTVHSAARLVMKEYDNKY